MNTMNYTDALFELQRLVEEIEQGDVNVDELSAKVKRCAELIRICREKLTRTEIDVKAILDDLEKESADEK